MGGDMRLDWLQAFLTFSQSMNFTRAAEALHISQPALYVKIGKLAKWLGHPLYRKEGRNLILTPVGVSRNSCILRPGLPDAA